MSKYFFITTVHCTKSCIYSQIAPEDGRVCCPKHVELI